MLGTAGGVRRLAEEFDDTFVVVSGDALTDVNISELVAFHKERDALATIALRRVYDTFEFGVVDVDEEGNIKGFQEKPDPQEAISTLANTGIYVFESRVLEYVPEDTFFDFAKDVFPRFLENGEKFVGYQGDFYWSDIGLCRRTGRPNTTFYRARCGSKYRVRSVGRVCGSGRTPRSTLQPIWKVTWWLAVTR